MEMHRKLVRTDPRYVASRLRIEQRMVAFRRTPRRMRDLIVIPVVVHVIYHTARENVSNEQIYGQMRVINRDFRTTNSDLRQVPAAFRQLIGDAKLEFKLAVRDSDGRPTNGITRKHTKVRIFELDDKMKFSATGGVDAWPADRYLNMWVCNIRNRHGYAQFPSERAETDGVVIDFQSFGTIGTAKYPFHLGRTATHEIGHWLNLNHVWGDDGRGCYRSDNVVDTPNQAGPNKGKPKFPHITCDNGPDGDLFYNYMDYSDDDIMCMFTRGQCERMWATLDGPRASLQYSDGLKKATSETARIRLVPPVTRAGRRRQQVFNGVQWV
jgi:hypothetical protein